MRKDPTYDADQIAANPVWKEAFRLSELWNDNAPIGWSDYIANANYVLECERKHGTSKPE